MKSVYFVYLVDLVCLVAPISPTQENRQADQRGRRLRTNNGPSLKVPSKLACAFSPQGLIHCASHSGHRAVGSFPIARVEQAPSERARSASRERFQWPYAFSQYSRLLILSLIRGYPTFTSLFARVGPRLLSNCARPTRAFRSRALREHGRAP